MALAQLVGFFAAEKLTGINTVILEEIEFSVVLFRFKDAYRKERDLRIRCFAYPVGEQSHGRMNMPLSPSCDLIHKHIGLTRCRGRYYDDAVVVGTFF